MNITDANKGRYAEVTDDNELKVCLCDKCCEGTVKLDDLQRIFPQLKISIRKEQLKS